MSTMLGKIRVVVADNAVSVAAAASNNGAAANKGTATDVEVIIATSATTGTVTATIQGSNVAAFTTPVAIVPDKVSAGITFNPTTGAITIPVSATLQQVVAHFAQLQYQFYRVVLAAAAASSITTANDTLLFMPVEDSFDSSVA